jgi:hypothetical protein
MARQSFGSNSARLVVFWTCALTVALPIPASTTAFVTFRGGLSAAHTAHHKHPSLCGLRRISSDVTVFACKDIAENVEGLEKRLVLLSLQWTNYHDDDGCMLPTALSDSELLQGRRHQRFFSKAVANVWRWKDAILGDGRDYFLPKPQTMAALQAYLRRSDDIAARSQHSQWPCQISECVVLSNCARFEILLVVLVPTDGIAQPKNSSNRTSDAATTWSDLVSYISFKLHRQVLSHQAKPNSIWSALPGDWPAVIDPLATTNQGWSGLPNMDPCNNTAASAKQPLDESVDELAQHWTVMDGPRDISRHLCLVAAGLATRPRRDDRNVVFRPFSSRDAHILCQLKRTHDIALSNNNPWLSIVLRSALQAGKAARNPKQIIALNVLRRNYGETGNSKFDMEPPMHVMKPIVDVRVASTLLETVIRTSHFYMLSVNRQYTR